MPNLLNSFREDLKMKIRLLNEELEETGCVTLDKLAIEDRAELFVIYDEIKNVKDAVQLWKLSHYGI
jgi:hypothetical protein